MVQTVISDRTSRLYSISVTLQERNTTSVTKSIYNKVGGEINAGEWCDSQNSTSPD